MSGVKGMKGGGGKRPGAGRKPLIPPGIVLGEPGQEVPPDGPVQDPLEFMARMMNNPLATHDLRLRAAVALAGFIHAKPGEAGKKEQRQADAAEVAQTGRFSARAAPPRLVVGGKA